MKEIEVKILDIDRKKVERRLSKLGAKKISDMHLHALFFDFDNQTVRRAKNLLRLRKEGKNSVLTFKGFVSNKGAKIRKEIEVEVSDFKKTKKILESVGLSIYAELKKRRITYELHGVHFEFDKYLGTYYFVPEFLEIEAKNLKTIFKYAKLLGFDKGDCKSWTGGEVIRYYGGN
jgi:adenylate cyclase class 2